MKPVEITLVRKGWKLEAYEDENGVFENLSGPGFMVSPGSRYCIKATRQVREVTHGVFGRGALLADAVDDVTAKMNEHEAKYGALTNDDDQSRP